MLGAFNRENSVLLVGVGVGNTQNNISLFRTTQIAKKKNSSQKTSHGSGVNLNHEEEMFHILSENKMKEFLLTYVIAMERNFVDSNS